MTTWYRTETTPPPEGVFLQTKVSDIGGDRMFQILKKSGNLWFVEDGSMYVYYHPTHWAYIEE